MNDSARVNNRILWCIVGAVLVWGLVHVVGAWRHNPLRGQVLLAFVLAFFACWVVLLLVHGRRNRHAPPSARGHSKKAGPPRKPAERF